WLIIGMLGSFLAATLINHFGSIIKMDAIVAAFIPLIGSTGGNVGIQSSSLIVQSLADKSAIDIPLSERLWKVFKVALLNAALAALVALAGTLLIDGQNMTLAITVSVSLFSVVLLASFMGTITPLILHKFDINPAIASGPFITTTNDLLGYGVYLVIVYWLML
nr:magnesium transporter [Pseudarcicella sp.]